MRRRPGSSIALLDSHPSEIIRSETGPTGNSSEHSGPDLVLIMKGKNEIGPAATRQGAMRAGFALDLPAEAQQGPKEEPGFGGRPLTHAA